MLWNASTIKDHAVAARDGRIGNIVDFLFDDTNWHIRWAVVKTGNWLSERRVLIPVSALQRPDAKGPQFPVDLTMQQIKDSPDVDTERPLSRQMETRLYGHYGWNPYWGDGLYFGAYGYGSGIGDSPFLGPRPQEREIIDAQHTRDDPHLRSIEVITGYHIHASDGEIGHLEDFLVEDADWTIRYLVVDTKNWWVGRKVLISRDKVQGIDWHDRLININTDRKAVEAGPSYDLPKSSDPTREPAKHFP